MFKHWKQIGIASLCAVIALAGFGMVKMNNQGEIIETAAVREYDPNCTEFYMDDNIAPLAESVNANSTVAMKKQLQIALDKTNQKRAEAGLSALKWDSSLAQCAAVRATEATQSWSHTRPNGSAWWTVNSQVQYGENLAKNYQSGENVVAGWMASPSHRQNLLASDYKTIGIAVYNYGGKWYWAQEFGY